MDPYKVLGVSKEATDDDIKQAYRRLMGEYDGTAKMDDINKAYDEIMTQRRLYGSSRANGNTYESVRSLVNQNRIEEAERLLESVPDNLRTAEWQFLRGSVCYAKGWLDEAYQRFEAATNMEPLNHEYKAAFDRMASQRNSNPYNRPGGYRQSGTNTVGCGLCDICTGLMCADCCCSCMGGRGCC